MKNLLSRNGLLSGLGLLAAGAVFAVAGCAPNVSEDQGTAASSETDQEIVTVKWWSWNPDSTTGAAWIEAFEAEHPNIKIEHNWIQYSDYVNAIRVALPSDDGPDVFGLQVGALTSQFAPLALDLGPLAAEGIGADWQEQLSATEQLVVDGKQVGMPWMITGAGLLWYNDTVLKAAGVEGPPSTKAEWEAACAAIRAIQVECFVHGAMDDWINIDMYQAIVNQVAPGEFYGAVNGEGDFTSAAFVEAFDIWKSLFDGGLVQAGALAQSQYPDANDAFVKGEAAFLLNGTWQNTYMTNSGLTGMADAYGPEVLDQVFLPVPLPDMVGGAKETGRLFGGPDVGWAVSANSSVQEAAWTFVQWLVSSETAQTKMGESLQGQPALKAIAVADSDVLNDGGKEALKFQGQQLGSLIGARQIPSAEVQNALGQALSAVASGQLDSAGAARLVQDAVDALG